MQVLKIVFLFSLSLIMLSTQILAQSPHQNTLLPCLAREESYYHQKKMLNASYRLNQNLINSLTSHNDILIKENYVQTICKIDVSKQPSLELLKLFMLESTSLFDYSLNRDEAGLKSFKVGAIEDFQKNIPRVFIDYILDLSQQFPNAKCLKKEMPELEYVINQIKYLEEEIHYKKLLDNKKLINTIFNKINLIDQYKLRCMKKEQERLSKIRERNDQARMIKK